MKFPPMCGQKFPLLNISVGPLYVFQSGNGIHIGIIAKTNIFGFRFVFLQPFPCSEIMIIDLFLVALLSFVALCLLKVLL